MRGAGVQSSARRWNEGAEIKLEGFYTNTKSPQVARVCGPLLNDGRPMCCSGCLVHRSLMEDSNVLLELSGSDEADSE